MYVSIQKFVCNLLNMTLDINILLSSNEIRNLTYVRIDFIQIRLKHIQT